MLIVVESWIKKEFGTIDELALILNRSPKTLKTDYVSELRKQKRLPEAKQGKRIQKKCRLSGTSVENSDDAIEEVNVVVEESAASSTAIEQPSNSIAIERPAAKPQNEPKVKRPKELAGMIDTHQKYIKERLLPIAQKLVALHNEVKTEQSRLHKAWTKDNLVFTTPYQRCVEYWNEREMFGEFAEAFEDPSIKTYADVLAAIRVKFRRCSERMASIEYSTGCTPDPNKRDLRM